MGDIGVFDCKLGLADKLFLGFQVSVRAEARSIGLRAVRRAAVERQREDMLAKERKALAASLPTMSDVRPAAIAVSRSLSPATAGERSAAQRDTARFERWNAGFGDGQHSTGGGEVAI